MPKRCIVIRTMITFLFSFISVMLYSQKPTHVPGPQNTPGIDFSDPFEVIVYIVIPVILVVIYFLWRRQVKKTKQEEEKNKKKE